MSGLTRGKEVGEGVSVTEPAVGAHRASSSTVATLRMYAKRTSSGPGIRATEGGGVLEGNANGKGGGRN